MKINKYILQQRQQCWNSNEHNKLLEMKPTLGEWKKLQKKPRRGGHIVQTSYRSYKNTFLLTAKQQLMCHACQTKYTVKHILIECTNLTHIRETFYSANDMKELFQNIEIKKCNVIPKSNKYIQKKLKEISTGPNFFYKLFLYKKYFHKLFPPHTLHFYDSLQINFP